MTDPPQLGAAFTWQARDLGSVIHIRFAGELDLRVASVAKVGLNEPLDGWRRTVVLDLSEVSFMDSSGLRLMIGLKHHIEDRQGRLLITRPSPQVERVLGVTRLDTFFDRLA